MEDIQSTTKTNLNSNGRRKKFPLKFNRLLINTFVNQLKPILFEIKKKKKKKEHRAQEQYLGIILFQSSHFWCGCCRLLNLLRVYGFCVVFFSRYFMLFLCSFYFIFCKMCQCKQTNYIADTSINKHQVNSLISQCIISRTEMENLFCVMLQSKLKFRLSGIIVEET